MPKKLGTSSKADAARDWKFAAEAEKKVLDSREQERYWKEAEGPKSRAAKKREEEVEKRAEAAARRAENRELAEQELLELQEKPTRKPVPKVTSEFFPVSKLRELELEHKRELVLLSLESEAEAASKRRSRTVDMEEYKRAVLVSNTNRDDSVIEAHSVADAIAKMAVSDATQPPDGHPERRLKASFAVRVLSVKNDPVLLINPHGLIRTL